MRVRTLLSVAAGAVMFMAGTASADSCRDRISQLERNVTKYERDGRYNDARLERQKLAQTRANCGYNNRGYGYSDGNDRWYGRDDRRDDRYRHDNGKHKGWYKNGKYDNDRWYDERWRDHHRDSRWRDRDGRNRDWFHRNGYEWRDGRWCRR